jgi:hypothetical protein
MYDIELVLNNLANQMPTWFLFLIIALCLVVLYKDVEGVLDRFYWEFEVEKPGIEKTDWMKVFAMGYLQ